MGRCVLASLLLFASACAHGPAQGSESRVVVSSAELARQTGLKPWAISLPFGANEDGTDLVLKFLDRAETSGARFVTQLQVVFVTQEEGQSLECRTRLSPDGLPPEEKEARVRMVSVTGKPLALLERVAQPYAAMMVTCQEVLMPGTTVTATTTSKGGRYDGMGPSSDPSFSSGGLRTATRCGSTPVTRYRYQYGFEAAAGYTPLNPQRLLAARPGLVLVQSDAECIPRPPHAPRNNRIEALAFGGVGPDAALFVPAPDEVAASTLEL
ncbi:hypothetical protein LY474_20835 [Myxococcus stipitatus]|uniref:hypothetical protein n=1 Tax=Myxococcus stipitatus TaxID=83455 RepID=UPI001F1833B1|nr:hypothetical protein [Myxococcus stipitatus]MCE9670248.1 hypothetical protein [Myxococcus stipitatus]